MDSRRDSPALPQGPTVSATESVTDVWPDEADKEELRRILLRRLEVLEAAMARLKDFQNSKL